MKTAVILGITGQDGAYLSQLLLSKNYKVIGIYRHNTSGFSRLKQLCVLEHEFLELKPVDLSNETACTDLIIKTKPNEMYNLASHSFVGDSLHTPIQTIVSSGMSIVYLLEAIRQYSKHTRFFQASSSEIFGDVTSDLQDENTAFNPRNPYSTAKILAHNAVSNYRGIYGVFACSGILYNHESPLRSVEFLTAKVASSVASIKLGLQECFDIGNMDAYRDWGYAKEYVECMYLMMQHETPNDYVISTGIATSVRQFIIMAFDTVGINIKFSGEGIHEYAVNVVTNTTVIKVNPEFYRPIEKNILLGDPTKADKILGWKAETDVKELCGMMVKNFLNEYKIENAK